MVGLVKANKNVKVLIVDDFAMSGDSLKEIVNLLEKKGFKRENIRTATIVCTPNAYDIRKQPNYYCIKNDYKEFNFPWGKAV